MARREKHVFLATLHAFLLKILNLIKLAPFQLSFENIRAYSPIVSKCTFLLLSCFYSSQEGENDEGGRRKKEKMQKKNEFMAAAGWKKKKKFQKRFLKIMLPGLLNLVRGMELQPGS